MKSDKSHDLSNVLKLAIDLRLSAKIGKLFDTATTRSQKKCFSSAQGRKQQRDGVP